jgi:hypothetical protein
VIIELVCIGAFILVSCGFALICARFFRDVERSRAETMVSYSKEIARVLAQADESRKASWTQLEHMSGRLVAVAWPVGHQVHRTTSGVVEGAQQKIAPHFANDGPVTEEDSPLDPTTGLDRLMERNGHAPDTRPRSVPTPDGYEEEQEEQQP